MAASGSPLGNLHDDFENDYGVVLTGVQTVGTDFDDNNGDGANPAVNALLSYLVDTYPNDTQIPQLIANINAAMQQLGKDILALTIAPVVPPKP